RAPPSVIARHRLGAPSCRDGRRENPPLPTTHPYAMKHAQQSSSPSRPTRPRNHHTPTTMPTNKPLSQTPTLTQTPNDMQTATLPFGKHRGETAQAIYETNPGCLEWVLRSDIAERFPEFAE